MKRRAIYMIIGITLVFILASFFVLKGKKINFVDSEGAPPILEISVGGEDIKVKPYYSKEDSQWFYILPAFLKTDGQLELEKKTKVFSCGEEYDVVFKQSENLTALFVNTESGGMEYLNSGKDLYERGFLTAVNNKGTIEYCDSLKKISGRGNGTWRDEEKKPYSFILKEPASLAGVNVGQRYNLHALSYEGDKLHSKFTYDLAAKMGQEFETSCNWVDVYFNGEYYGLYLLRESPRVESNRLQIENDGFLIERDREGSWENNHEDYFYSSRGETFVFRYPEVPTDEEKQYVIDKANEVEETIVNQEPLGELIDVKSFAIQYLCDEISKNFDAFKTSVYFYQKSKTDTFHAGPVWDYDGGYGDFLEEGEAFSDPTGSILGVREGQMVWYHAIIYNEEFQKEAFAKYVTVQPWIKEMLDTGFDKQADMIKKSVELDRLRWKDDHTSLSNDYAPGLYNDYDNEVRYLKWYLAKRLNYLSSNWNLDVEEYNVPETTDQYHTVTFVKDGKKEDSQIKDGETLEDIETGVWMIGDTLDPINRFIPIYEDMILNYAE